MGDKPKTRRKYHRPPGAAGHLEVGISTLAKWRMAGTGPKFKKLGSKIVIYDEDDLDEYAAARTISSTSQIPGVV